MAIAPKSAVSATLERTKPAQTKHLRDALLARAIEESF